MGKILSNLSWAFIFGLVLAVILLVVQHGTDVAGDNRLAFEWAFLRWIHVFFGILWIGLLYYFNIVQIPTMPKVPAELKPGISKFIAPEALFWFRWSALGTVVLGAVLAWRYGYIAQALTFQPPYTTIGIGMWLGIIMMLNVWGIIWPNQKRALGLVDADADTKAKSARTAMLGSRANFVMSLPMLYAMTTFQTLGH